MLSRGIASILVLAVLGGGGYKVMREVTQKASNRIERATGVTGDAKYFEEATLANLKDDVKSKSSSDELLEVVVTDTTFSVKLRKASDDSAFGYQAVNGVTELQDVEVKVSGSGKLKDSVFTFDEFDPAVPAKILKTLQKKVGSDVKLNTLSLSRKYSADGEPQWSGNYDTKTRTSLSFQAKPNGKIIDLDKV